MVEFLNEIAFNGILFYVQLNKIWFHELLWSDIYIYLQYFSWLLPKCGTSNTDLYSSTCLCITYYILWQLKLENKNLFCFNGTNFRKMSMNFIQWKIFGIQFLYAYPGHEECSFLTKRIFFFITFVMYYAARPALAHEWITEGTQTSSAAILLLWLTLQRGWNH